MSEEEKEAIKITKTLIEFAGEAYIPKRNREKLQILLDLIDKQQKEIEKLKATPKYRFNITYMNKDQYGYYSEQQYTVSLIAETLEQAELKLDKIAPNYTGTFKDIVKWSAEELEEK